MSWATGITAAGGLACVTASAASAGPTLGDRGFESPAAGPSTGYHLYDPNAGYLAGAGPSPWTFLGTSGVSRPGWQGAAYSPPEGEQVAFLQTGDGSVDSSDRSAIRQVMTGLTPAAAYRVTFRAGSPANDREIVPTRVHVLVDGAEVANVLPGEAFDAYATAAFVGPAGGAAELTFVGDGLDGMEAGQPLTLLDDVGVTSVPEVSGAWGAAVVGAGLARRRRGRR